MDIRLFESPAEGVSLMERQIGKLSAVSVRFTENLYQCNEKIIPKWIAKLLKIASETLDKGEENHE